MPGSVYVAFTLFMIGLDVVAVALGFGLAYYLRFEAGFWPFTEYQPWSYYLPLALVLGLTFPIVFALRRQYQPRLAFSRIADWRGGGSGRSCFVVSRLINKTSG